MNLDEQADSDSYIPPPPQIIVGNITTELMLKLIHMFLKIKHYDYLIRGPGEGGHLSKSITAHELRYLQS